MRSAHKLSKPCNIDPAYSAGKVWPGAMSRSKRNGFIERWAGQEWALRPRVHSRLSPL